MFEKLKSIRVQLPKRLQLGLSKEQREEGVTLIELLAVVVILGIISAIAVPAVSSAINNAKVTATMNDEGTIQVALQRYYDHMGYYPATLSILSGTYSTTNGGASTTPPTAGPYLSNQFPESDGWGNYIYYAPVGPANAATGYILLSGDGNSSPQWTLKTGASGVQLSNLPGSGSNDTYIYAGGGSIGSGSSLVQLGSQPTTGTLPSSDSSAVSSGKIFIDN